MASLKSMNREQLNAEATRMGIADADQLETNAEVITAIEVSDKYKAEADAIKAEREAAEKAASKAPKEPTAPKTTYIVNGVEVDPNGKPVKD